MRIDPFVYDSKVKSLVPLLALVLLAAPIPVETASKAESRITEASVLGHLEFLAGDALNGRGSGTRDEWIAATYIGAQLRRWRRPRNQLRARAKGEPSCRGAAAARGGRGIN